MTLYVGADMETVQTMGVRQRRYHEAEFSHQMFVTKKRRGAQSVDNGEEMGGKDGGVGG